MLRFTFMLLAFFFFESCSPSLKPKVEAGIYTDASRKRKINKYFNALTKLDQFNGVVFASDQGAPIFKEAFNINDEKSTSFVTVNSQFDIHSLSKLIAKTLIVQMEQSNLINRQNYLEKYLPDFPNGDKITIQHLMDNRSGLPRELDLKGVTKNSLTSEEIIQWAKKEALEFEPGTDKRYSNVGFELLYFIIGKMQNTTFSGFVKEDFFQKLNMQNSGGHFYCNKNNLTNLAQNHESGDNEIMEPVENITDEDFKQSMLYSTVEDLQLFLNFISNEPYSSALQNSKGIITWSGGSDGIRSHVHYNTKTKASFVILANYDEIPLETIIEDMAKMMNGDPVKIPKRVKRQEVVIELPVLEQYVGTYDIVEANHLLLEIRIVKGKLALFQDGELAGELYAENETTFFADPKSKDSFQFVSIENSWELLMDWKGVQLKGTKIK